MTMNVKTHLLELNQQNQNQNGNGVNKWNRQKISHCKITQQKNTEVSKPIMNSFAFDYAKMNCIASEFQLDQWEDEY